jgi:hypothetical protein
VLVAFPIGNALAESFLFLAFFDAVRVHRKALAAMIGVCLSTARARLPHSSLVRRQTLFLLHARFCSAIGAPPIFNDVVTVVTSSSRAGKAVAWHRPYVLQPPIDALPRPQGAFLAGRGWLAATSGAVEVPQPTWLLITEFLAGYLAFSVYSGGLCRLVGVRAGLGVEFNGAWGRECT